MTAPTAPRLDAHELAELGPPEAVRLPLDLISPNARNPRRSLPEIDELAASIRSFSLLQPITVRRVGDTYELLGGHRRLAAFQLLRQSHPEDVQWRTIPAVIRTADDASSYRMLISAQIHSRNWRPREEASALEALVASGLTLKEIGEQLNRTESWASRRLRIYADAILSPLVQTGQLAPGVAEEILLIRDAPTRKQFAERAVAEGWSQDHARGQARSLRLDKQLAEVAKRARELLSILSQVDPSRLPTSAMKDLWTLRGRVDQIGRGGPVIPSIEAAQRAAGVKQQERPQRDRRKAGYRPRT